MMADLIIMPSLALIAAQYTFLLFGLRQPRGQHWCTLALGIVFIMAMTWICVVGIELSARTQMLLLVTELAVLVLFSVVALVKVYAGTSTARCTRRCRGSRRPTSAGASALTEGLLAAVFIYWGWDTATSVNEECENANTTPASPACSPRSSSC